jgi:hypothetical protein
VVADYSFKQLPWVAGRHDEGGEVAARRVHLLLCLLLVLRLMSLLLWFVAVTLFAAVAAVPCTCPEAPAC